MIKQLLPIFKPIAPGATITHEVTGMKDASEMVLDFVVARLGPDYTGATVSARLVFAITVHDAKHQRYFSETLILSASASPDKAMRFDRVVALPYWAREGFHLTVMRRNEAETRGFPDNLALANVQVELASLIVTQLGVDAA